MSRRGKDRTRDGDAVAPRHNMRVLRDPIELAQATARAAEGERRLRARLDAQAAHDACTAERRQTGPGVRVVAGLRNVALSPPLGHAGPVSAPESSPHSPAA